MWELRCPGGLATCSFFSPGHAFSVEGRPRSLALLALSPSPPPPSPHLSLCVFLPVYLLPPSSSPTLPCAVQYIPAVLLASLYLENEQ